MTGLFGNAECRCGIEAAKAWGTTGDAGLARIPECPMWGELAARLARIVPKNPRKLERALGRGLALRIVCYAQRSPRPRPREDAVRPHTGQVWAAVTILVLRRTRVCRLGAAANSVCHPRSPGSHRLAFAFSAILGRLVLDF